MTKEVFIKYNPYRLKTEIKIDDKPVKDTSKLNVSEMRLQEWIDKLPKYLKDECNTADIEIKFYGTELDYEDLKEVVDNFNADNTTNITTEHLQVKESIEDKEEAIKKIFEEIQNGPIDELKTPEIINAFKQAQSDDFEVNVVATMSSGKSTLINAMLGEKLMPAYNQACTATITRIKDNDKKGYTATAFDKEDNVLKKLDMLDYNIMSKLNKDDNVQEVHIDGDIPFVSSKDTNLILVDTPGPNNSRNSAHRDTTFNALEDSPKTLVLYVLNATQLGIRDDSVLLEKVAKEMGEAGKRSHDRFIFVVNKMDEFDPSEENISDALKEAQEYLDDNGIKNPNIYPASAFTALGIKTKLSNLKKQNANITPWDDSIDDLTFKLLGLVRKLNGNESLHFEKYAPLPKFKEKKIQAELTQAKENNDINKQALIHSGIPSIEEAIRLYIEKYAKTTKIKILGEKLENFLISEHSLAELKKEIAESEEKRREITKKIKVIEQKISDGTAAKKYKAEIDLLNADKELETGKNKIMQDAQNSVRKAISEVNLKGDLKPSEALYEAKKIDVQLKQIQSRFRSELEVLKDKTVKQKVDELIAGYVKRLASLSADISTDGPKVDLKKLMLGEISVDTNNLVDSVKDTKEVVVDTVYVKNYNKRWFKPWTWFEESGHYEDVTEEQEYVSATKFSQLYLNEIQKSLYENGATAVKLAKEEVEEMKAKYKEKFVELDNVLKDKMNEIKKYQADDKKNKDNFDNLKELATKQEWLEGIQKEMDAILDI